MFIAILTAILSVRIGSTHCALTCDYGKIVDDRVVSSSHFSKSSATQLHQCSSCNNGELWWSSLRENEIPSLEAIQTLHRQLDDDMNGNVDLSESDEFLREELQYEQGYQNRHENFHRNNDGQVSVEELWTMWVNSQVHNWTIDQTAEWVATVVELHQYQEKFRQLKINGTYLPLLAVNYHNFLAVYLGIKDVIARQKLSLKAQDAVLFGPPKDSSSYTKDAIFIVLLLTASSMSYWVYTRNVKMSKDMKALMKSEDLLRELQMQLEQTKRDQEMQSKSKDGFLTDIKQPEDADELAKLQGEVKHLRTKLHRAEVELQLKRWIPPPELIYWLQVTYDLETKEHKRKQDVAEKLLKRASKACDKLKKRRSSILNAFIPIHSRSIDDVDSALVNAKSALTELLEEYRERMRRWNQIEILLNPDIDIQTDSRSVSILSTELWSHSRSLIRTVQEANNMPTTSSGQLEVLNDASVVPTYANNRCVGTKGGSLVGSERKYPSWQKVKRLFTFDERPARVEEIKIANNCSSKNVKLSSRLKCCDDKA